MVKFRMNVYFTPDKLVRESIDIEKSVFERLIENKFEDLHYALSDFENEEIRNIAHGIIDSTKFEASRDFIFVLIDTIKFDSWDTAKRDYELLSYTVWAKLDVEQMLKKFN